MLPEWERENFGFKNRVREEHFGFNVQNSCLKRGICLLDFSQSPVTLG